MGDESKRASARTASGCLCLRPPLVLFALSFYTQTEEKWVVKKTRKYLCTFPHIYVIFQSDACSVPHHSQDFSPINKEAREIRITLAHLCGITQEGQRRSLWLFCVNCTGRVMGRAVAAGLLQWRCWCLGKDSPGAASTRVSVQAKAWQRPRKSWAISCWRSSKVVGIFFLFSFLFLSSPPTSLSSVLYPPPPSPKPLTHLRKPFN